VEVTWSGPAFVALLRLCDLFPFCVERVRYAWAPFPGTASRAPVFSSPSSFPPLSRTRFFPFQGGKAGLALLELRGRPLCPFAAVRSSLNSCRFFCFVTLISVIGPPLFVSSPNCSPVSLHLIFAKFARFAELVSSFSSPFHGVYCNREFLEPGEGVESFFFPPPPRCFFSLMGLLHPPFYHPISR